ncbi:MAG: M13 family metallopeptidase [Bdellovibrionota bacterium]
MNKGAFKHSQVFSLLALCLLGVSCTKYKESAKSKDDQNAFVLKEEKMLDPTTIDKQVDPCTDYYQYACGNWIKTTPLSPEYSRWVRSFSTMAQLNLKTQREILDELAVRNNLDSDSKKLADYYSVCSNEQKAELNDIDLKKQLIELDTLSIGSDFLEKLPSVLARLHLQGVAAFFDLSASPDPDDVLKVITHIDRSGLGLSSDSLTYLSDADQDKELRAAYKKHIEAMFLLSSYSPSLALEAAADAYDIEISIAKNILSGEARRDPHKTKNKFSLEDFKALLPTFSMEKYMEALGAKNVGTVNVLELDYIKSLSTLLNDYSAAQVSNYLKWQLLRSSASALSAKYADESFNFYGKILMGQKAQTPRWKRCVDESSDALGQVMGRLFVERKFSPQAKEATKTMVESIQVAYKEIIQNLDWMDQETKDKALEKLSLISKKFGYPDKWDEYADLNVSDASYLLNRQNLHKFETEKNLAKIGKKTDRSEWFMTPQTVNAYYNPEGNEIVFPAAILATPFYDVNAPVAANFGAAGMVIGHEITHGFDDQGSQYDKVGNLTSWWSANSESKFKEKTQCVSKQYAEYSIDGTHLRGDFTLGENIADVGGIKIAYKGFLNAKPNATLEEKKNFFLAFAQIWCAKATPQYYQNQIKNDYHSPAKFRVNGPLMNLEAFSEVHSCAQGMPMNPADKCTVW